LRLSRRILPHDLNIYFIYKAAGDDTKSLGLDHESFWLGFDMIIGTKIYVAPLHTDIKLLVISYNV
jgi:hypothetical protein